MTTTDTELRQALGDQRPTDEEIRAVLAAAKPVRSRRRWRRLALVYSPAVATSTRIATPPHA